MVSFFFEMCPIASKGLSIANFCHNHFLVMSATLWHCHEYITRAFSMHPIIIFWYVPQPSHISVITIFLLCPPLLWHCHEYITRAFSTHPIIIFWYVPQPSRTNLSQPKCCVRHIDLFFIRKGKPTILLIGFEPIEP